MKGICQTYYFHEEIDFSDIFSDVICFSEIIPHVFSQSYEPDFLAKNLSPITPNEIKKMEEKEVPSEFDCFKLQKIHLYSVDNVNKTINYDCTCSTEEMMLGNDFVDIYCEVDLCGITWKINTANLYNQLIVDSYRKYLQKDFRMAYFLMYSAFECFINTKSGKHDEEKRLVQKKNELFKLKFSCLNSNQINSSVDMKKYEDIRNDIAHGREEFNIKKELVDDIYFDFLSLIISFEENIQKFEELAKFLQKQLY